MSHSNPALGSFPEESTPPNTNQTTTHSKRVSLRLTQILSLIPLVGYLLLLSLAIKSYLSTGHWPFYNHPDPKQLNLPFLYHCVGVSLIASIIAFLATPLFIAIHWIRFGNEKQKPRERLRFALLFYLLSISTWGIDIMFGSNLITWYID